MRLNCHLLRCLNGFLVDDNQLKEFADKLGEKIDALTNEIYMLAGENLILIHRNGLV